MPSEEFRELIEEKKANKRKYLIIKKNLKVTDPKYLAIIAKLKQKKQRLKVCDNWS